MKICEKKFQISLQESHEGLLSFVPREFGLSRYHEYTLSYQNIQATPDIEIRRG